MQKVSKISFYGKQKLTACTAQSVTKWNQSSSGSATTIHACGVSKYEINNLCDIYKQTLSGEVRYYMRTYPHTCERFQRCGKSHMQIKLLTTCF